MRIGFEKYGGKCVFSSEIDAHARETYNDNFNEMPLGDIRKIKVEEIPEHDILLAGFPCQPFSIAGVSKSSSMKKKAIQNALNLCYTIKITKELERSIKKLEENIDIIDTDILNLQFERIMDTVLPLTNDETKEKILHHIEEVGIRENGFLEKTKGTLFFEICRILEHCKPRAFLLENVKGLTWHNEGKTFRTIIDSLENLGYNIKWKVVNSKNFVPQRRERIFIIGFSDDTEFKFSEMPEEIPILRDILDNEVEEKYTLNDHLWNYHQERKRKQKEKGNGFGYRIFTEEQSSGTLPARYYKDGADILIKQEGKNPRMLTPRECARLMGFPESFILNKSENQAYKQLGNAVVSSLVSHLAKDIVEAANWK